jgi:hypothetical protein
MASETRTIERFTRINFKDFGSLVLSQGDHESLTIEADEDLLADLLSDVRDETLFLGFKDDWFNRIGKIVSSIFTGEDLKVTYYLTCVNLEQISISGKCTLTSDSLSTDKLRIKVAGLGNLTFANLDCNTLEYDISGRGELKAKGRAGHQEIRISGSGEVQAPDLISQSARVAISGQGNITLSAAESLSVTISGIGYVNYHGSPNVSQIVSGIGNVKRLNTV